MANRVGVIRDDMIAFNHLCDNSSNDFWFTIAYYYKDNRKWAIRYSCKHLEDIKNGCPATEFNGYARHKSNTI